MNAFPFVAPPFTDPSLLDAARLVRLVEHVVQRHHAFARDALERLLPMSLRVLRNEPEHHAALARVRVLLDIVADDLLPHMLKEERVLFPAISRLAAGQRAAPAFGRFEYPVSMQHVDHEHLVALLRELALVTQDYRAPAGAAPAVVALYAGIAEFDADLRLHLMLEEEVLFPALLRLECAIMPE